MKRCLNFWTVALSIFMLCGCGADGSQHQQQMVYASAIVEKSDVTVEQRYSAAIRGRQDINIFAQVAGTITKVCVTEGQVVAEMIAKNNTVLVMSGQADTLGFSGWAAFTNAPAVEFGYYIGEDMVIITDSAFTQDRPDLAVAGIVNGAGYNITVSIDEIPVGTHPVGVIAKLEDGTYAQFYSCYLQIVLDTAESSR